MSWFGRLRRWRIMVGGRVDGGWVGEWMVGGRVDGGGW